MQLFSWSAEQIVTLIKERLITDPQDVITAYNEILRRVIFHDEIVDMVYFEKLSSAVLANDCISTMKNLTRLPPPSYQQAVNDIHGDIKVSVSN
ncbi:hypothetical protein ILUMI_22810 [Ignelater luminosus]|uniref:Uncharacterized protein n=1 Tax=Ignelater luminosus TaxID=2038154 RepID=A0A8K0FX85_IGNLU|nr:hypothetical protein ILUMI_22810 [Ignelater luminosus]